MNEAVAAVHAVERGGVRLHVLERWCGAPAGKPVAVLVHGSTTPGGPTFDLELAGRPWTSLARLLAAAGLDVFVPDVRGFGRSARPEAGVAAPEAVEDVAAVIEHACALRGAAAVSLVGFSWGAQVAGLLAAARPARVARLVLYAPPCRGSRGLAARRATLPRLRAAAYLPVSAAEREARFRADVPPAAIEADVAAAFARAAEAAQPRVPTGPWLDLLERGPFVDPRALRAPTLVVHGVHDELSDEAELRALVAALAAPGSRLAVVPDAGHFAHLQRGARALHEALIGFLAG